MCAGWGGKSGARREGSSCVLPQTTHRSRCRSLAAVRGTEVSGVCGLKSSIGACTALRPLDGDCWDSRGGGCEPRMAFITLRCS